jgi:cytochrome c
MMVPAHRKWNRKMCLIVRSRTLGSYSVRLDSFGCVAISLLVSAVAACQEHSSTTVSTPRIAAADTDRGSQLIASYGCGACHQVPGVDGADGVVGPPLSQFARRVYVAGMVRNTPDNLMDWLKDPQSIVPGNAMPNLGVTTRDARDMAGYLYTLQ